MTKMIRIHNTETDEIIDREMTADEIKQDEIDAKADQARIKVREQNIIKKAAVLERLGITADEAALLLQ